VPRWVVPAKRMYAGATEEQRRADRRARLVQAGYDLLAAGGSAAVTVSGVCRGAGLSSRYFYEHFDSREGLLAVIFNDEADSVIRLLTDTAWETPGGLEARSRAVIGALLDAVDADPRRSALGRGAARDDVILRVYATMTARMIEEFVSQVGRVSDLTVSPVRVRSAASLIVAGIMQLFIEWVKGDCPLERRDLIDLSAAFVVSTWRLAVGPD